MDRLKSALENLDQAIDMAESALDRQGKTIARMVEDEAVRRVKAAMDTAEQTLMQAQQGERRALERAGRQKETTNIVARRLDQAIMRLEKMVGD
jgi:predicted 2-oxoglutarate/Fe(II)-dependent dioxygenase YbiX